MKLRFPAPQSAFRSRSSGRDKRHDVDREGSAPFEEVVDEVDQPGVGEVEVLEDQDDRGGRREALEERPPGGEQLLGASSRRLDPEQRKEGRLDPAPLGLIRDVGPERLGDLRPGRRLIVGLEQPAPLPDHLAQGPEADPVAVGRRAAVVPPDGVDQAVDVLQELPGEARLAEARRPDHAHQPGPALPGGRVEQVLEQAQLVVTADERGLEGLGPIPAADLGDDPERAPRRHGRGLALEGLLPGLFEGDRLAGGPLGRLAHEHGPRLGHGLEPRGGVDEVAGDHALVRRAERDRRLAGQDAGAGLDRRAERADRVDQVEPSPDGPLGVILVGVGAPQTAITASPMNFSTMPPYRPMTSRARSK